MQRNFSLWVFPGLLGFFKLPSAFPGPTLFIYIMKICFMTINSNKGLWTYELQIKIFEEIENKNAPLLAVKSSEHLASDVFVNMAVNHCKHRAVSFKRSHQVYLGTKQLVVYPKRDLGTQSSSRKSELNSSTVHRLETNILVWFQVF